MKLRIITVAVALVLACIGAYLILSYVQGADQRALAASTPTATLVVTQPVPAGTPAEDLSPFVETRLMPLSAVPADAMTALSDSIGTVTGVDLVPGEVLLSSRLVDPASLETPGTVAAPAGMQELTVQLTLDRVVGGRVAAGDTVGVFISSGAPQSLTHLQLHKVLVTGIQGGSVAVTEEDAESAEPENTTGVVLVTMALSAKDAEKVVFGAEFGSIWLSLEPADAEEGGTVVVTPENVFS